MNRMASETRPPSSRPSLRAAPRGGTDRLEARRWEARLRAVDFAVGGFALAAIVLHVAAHVHSGHWYDALWLCDVAAACVGPAVLARSAALSAVCFTWLLPGTAVWLLDTVLAGAHILPTSYSIHVGGLIVAAYGVWRFGYVRRGWLYALAFLAAVLVAARTFSPGYADVDAVFRVPKGWSFLGGSYTSFALSAAALAVGMCVIGQVGCWLITRRGRHVAERRSGGAR